LENTALKKENKDLNDFTSILVENPASNESLQACILHQIEF